EQALAGLRLNCSMLKTFFRIGTVLMMVEVCSAAPAPQPIALGQKDLSFRNEVQRAIDRGLMWFEKNQHTNGYWSTPDQPAVTALVLAACKGDPTGRFNKQEPSWIKK